MEGSVRKVKDRVVKSFRDVVILAVLKENDGLNGYEIIQRLYEKLGVLLPPGTLYSTLYALEREMLVKGVSQSKSRVYKLTSKGLARL